MRYKVGDKVRVRNDLDEQGCKYGLNDNMLSLRGKVVTIQEALIDEYNIKEDGHTWQEKNFDPIKGNRGRPSKPVKEPKRNYIILTDDMEQVTFEEGVKLLSECPGGQRLVKVTSTYKQIKCVQKV